MLTQTLTFYRDSLKSQQARSFYDSMAAGIAAGNTGGIFPLTYTERSSAIRDGFDALHALHCDRPEYFFIGNETEAVVRGAQLYLMNKVLYTPEQILRIHRQLRATVLQLTACVPGLSDWHREKLVYERLIRRLTYADHGKDYDHNIVGPLLQGSGVCEGFSCLLILALRHAGIPCIRVSGFGKNEAHCWVMAYVDGSPAHLDITWDTVNEQGDVAFSYFNLTDEQIGRDHSVKTKGLPRCIDPTNGYHFRKELLASSVGEAAKICRSAFSRGRSVSLRFNFESDVSATVKKAMRQVPVSGYAVRYSESQRTALIWSA